MFTGTTITLPSGFWLGGVHHRQADLRPLTGEDEAYIAEGRGAWLPAERTTAVLGRCLISLGSLSLADEDPQALVRQLTVGDREALMLHLRRVTLGDHLSSVVRCPSSGCSQPMDLDLRVSDLLLPPYAQPQPEYQVTVQQDGLAWRIRFHLPTGENQEEAARRGRSQVEEGIRLLISRCIIEITTDETEGKPIPMGNSPPDWLAEKLSSLLVERDPQSEMQLELTCPSCGQKFNALFDPASYFFREIASRSMHLYRQVHQLAFYYHWSEAEIMGMTAVKRLRYLDLLEDALREAGRYD